MITLQDAVRRMLEARDAYDRAKRRGDASFAELTARSRDLEEAWRVLRVVYEADAARAPAEVSR